MADPGKACDSMRGKFIFDHLSILHDKPDALEFGYVGYGVARYRGQIGKFPNLDGANPERGARLYAFFNPYA